MGKGGDFAVRYNLRSKRNARQGVCSEVLNEIPPQLHPNCLFLKVCFSTATSHCPNMPLISHFSFITAVFLHQELHKTRFGRWKNLLIAVQNFSLCFISACSRQVWQPCVLSMCSSLRPELREGEGGKEREREGGTALPRA